MRNLFFLFIFCWSISSCDSGTSPKVTVVQDSIPDVNPYSPVDKSPMDMAWGPSTFPVDRLKGIDSSNLYARLLYSRPHRAGRVIFGEGKDALCQYGKPWRLGANEATEIAFFQNVSIGGKTLEKGMYVMYCIPHADKWTIVFNSNLYSWGLDMQESKDLLRTDIPVSTQDPALEDFTMSFAERTSGADLIMAWDNKKAVLPIVFLK